MCDLVTMSCSTKCICGYCSNPCRATGDGWNGDEIRLLDCDDNVLKVNSGHNNIAMSLSLYCLDACANSREH